MATIELSDVEIKEFLEYRKHQDKIHQIFASGLLEVVAKPNWKELYTFAKKLDYGQALIKFEAGQPVKVENPMQTIMFGMSLENR